MSAKFLPRRKWLEFLAFLMRTRSVERSSTQGKPVVISFRVGVIIAGSSCDLGRVISTYLDSGEFVRNILKQKFLGAQTVVFRLDSGLA